MNRTKWVAGLGILATLIGVVLVKRSAGHVPKQQPTFGYDDTPLLPGSKWRVHDGRRPQPAVVTPGTFSAPEEPGKPPSDAIALFDGTDLSKWQDDRGEPARWKVENGYMEVVPRTDSIRTRGEFADFQLHIEWRTPVPAKGEGQGRGNSGVFLLGRYELQVLDSYENRTYPDGQAGALYGQYPPLVNASRKPGEWQVYDIIFTAPRFKDSSVEAPAYISVLHNGVVIHNHTPFLGATVHRKLAAYSPHGLRGPILLQDHGDPVRYRNIWIRPLRAYDEP